MDLNSWHPFKNGFTNYNWFQLRNLRLQDKDINIPTQIAN